MKDLYVLEAIVFAIVLFMWIAIGIAIDGLRKDIRLIKYKLKLDELAKGLNEDSNKD